MRWHATAILLACFMVLPSGCTTTPVTDNPPTDDPTKPPAVPNAPAYDHLAGVHNRRVDRLKRLHSQGVIELRWEDDRGKHFEQGNVRLWLDLPHKTALRVEKLGDVLLWLGSDETEFWFFDLISDETMLVHGQHDQEIRSGAVGAIGLKPLALLDLIGLTPLPPRPPLAAGDEPSTDLPPDVSFDAQRNAWTVEAQGAGGRMRLYFDPMTFLPVRIESLDSEGIPVAASELDRHRPVETEGSLSVNWPRLPTLIDIDLGGQARSLKLALDSPTTIVEGQPMDRVFDLARLRKAMPTDHEELLR